MGGGLLHIKEASAGCRVVIPPVLLRNLNEGDAGFAEWTSDCCV